MKQFNPKADNQLAEINSILAHRSYVLIGVRVGEDGETPVGIPVKAVGVSDKTMREAVAMLNEHFEETKK